ncbi:MAG: hypothetical protein ACYC6F_00485 [Longimicrobiales bacterium]
MAKQTILWTVLPHGRVEKGDYAGHFRVSVVVSPRLTPQATSEQKLGTFPEFLDWPATLATAKLSLRLHQATVGLVPLGQGDSGLWAELFDKHTPVAGFEFQDMSKANLRSFPVRSVLGFLRKHYGKLAVQAAATHPTLLPWSQAHPDLKGMLTDLGTRTQKFSFGDRQVEVALPGFSRFFDDSEKGLDHRIASEVFGPDGRYSAPVVGIGAEQGGLPGHAGQFTLRVLPADWSPGGPDAALMSEFASADEYAFYQASRFYRREPPTAEQRRMRRPSFKDIAPPPAPPEYDFHRIVASYGNHPALLRALGLVIDCAVEDGGPLEALISAGGGTAVGDVSVALKWSGSHDDSSDATPRTAWYADKERFVARPRTPDHERGLLRLASADDRWSGASKEKSPFAVFQVDPDGSALKTVGFTLTAQGLVAKSLTPAQPDGKVTYTTGDKQGVAALRSGGLGISRHDLATQVAQDAAASALKNAAVEAGNADHVVFFAEDVLRGYRLDVAPVPDAASPGKWYSLCAREARYRLIESGETLPLPKEDEGYVSGASTTSSADDAVDPDDHYLHESMFRWTGWSLCAPRPGLVLRAETVPDTQIQAEQPTQVTDEADHGNGVAPVFKTLKGSLPRLRFGQLYRMRARLVDLAGNSLAVYDPTLGPLENATDAVGFWRFEPVDPPVLVQRTRFSEGESLERMVIRSNWDAKPEGYLTTPDFAAATSLPESQDFEYDAASERHVVPPKSSQQQCEQHGLFDPFFGDPDQIKKGYEIAAREAGTLYDELPGSQVELVTPSSLEDVATTADIPPAMPSAENPVGDRTVGGQYVIHREAQLATPYLPDGACAGVALRAASGHELPGVTGPMTLGPGCVVAQAPNNTLVLLVANAGDWPDAHGVRITLAERQAQLVDLPCAETFPDSGAPRWDPDQRVLTFFVPKGRIVRLLYSSFIHPDFVHTFGIPHWTASESERKFVLDMAGVGCHWMLTPYRTLTLVHATQQPLCLPELIKMTPSRPAGAHHADLHCRTVRLHGPSTGKFEIEAEWEEWVDDLEKSGPERIQGHGQLGEIQLAENHPNTFPLQTAVAAQQVDPSRERARGDRHDLGDTKFRLIRYRVRATTRFREYLPPSLYEQSELVTRLGPVALGPGVKVGADDDPGAPVLLDPTGSQEQSFVPASDAPDDPRVLYVVPTFRWQRTEAPGSLQLTRLGNGLRVWLDRPWFSSGDGELLGVVLSSDGGRFTDIPAHMQSLVTQWGLDPLWDTALPKWRTAVTDFPARVHAEAVRLQERPEDAMVHVVGHRVRWDEVRHLWYCDIELEPGASYMPFVRLALVRYQPNALQSAKISKVVLAEFAQVLPRRHAVFHGGAGTAGVTLKGTVPHFGPMKFPLDSEYQDISYPHGVHETGRNRVELVLQTRDPAIDSDLAWRDFKILAAAVVAPPGAAPDPFPGPDIGAIDGPLAPAPAPEGRTVHTRVTGAVRLGAEVSLGRIERVPGIGALIDPEIWQTSVTLPSTGGKPARLMLREFERYYTDRTVPERKDGEVRRRRVIEERLVYAAVFDL